MIVSTMRPGSPSKSSRWIGEGRAYGIGTAPLSPFGSRPPCPAGRGRRRRLAGCRLRCRLHRVEAAEEGLYAVRADLAQVVAVGVLPPVADRKSTRLNSSH